MPRNLTPRGRRAAQAQSDVGAMLWLLTITHAPTSSLFRAVNNITAITSRGNVFAPYAFDVKLAEESLDRVPAVQLVIDNVDRALVDMVRAAQAPPVVKLELIVSDAPDVVEFDIPQTFLREAEWNASQITGKLEPVDVFTQKFPSRDAMYTPLNTPGLFV
jgi:hypothetical protein